MKMTSNKTQRDQNYSLEFQKEIERLKSGSFKNKLIEVGT